MLSTHSPLFPHGVFAHGSMKSTWRKDGFIITFHLKERSSHMIESGFYRPHTEYDGKVMFSVFLSVHRAPRSRSRSRSQGAQVKVWVKVFGAPQVKVWVKVWAPPRARSRSRSGAPRLRSGAPQVKVWVKVWAPPRSRSESRSEGPPGQGLGQALGAPQVNVRVGGPPGQGPGWARSSPPPQVKVGQKYGEILDKKMDQNFGQKIGHNFGNSIYLWIFNGFAWNLYNKGWIFRDDQNEW